MVGSRLRGNDGVEIVHAFYPFATPSKSTRFSGSSDKDAAPSNRLIKMTLGRPPGKETTLNGAVRISGNDYYTLEKAGLPQGHFTYNPGIQRLLESTISTPAITPSQQTSYATAFASLTIQRPKRSISPTPSHKDMATSTTTYPSPLISPCDQLSDYLDTQACQAFLVKLGKMEVAATFSEAKVVKTSEQLIAETQSASVSGKVIVLHQGRYEFDQPLSITNPVAWVGIDTAVIGSAESFTSPDDNALVRLGSSTTDRSFFTNGITWDITAPDDTDSKPFESAVKALNHEGKLVILGNHFQYHASHSDSEPPSHYIDAQNSTGNLIIADNTFLSGGLQSSMISANCKECEEDNQIVEIKANLFTDSNHQGFSTHAIDVKYYQSLNISQNRQQGTATSSATINVVLPNNKDAINAQITHNTALADAKEVDRTISLTVGKLAKVPVSMGGSVNITDNHCYHVMQHAIPPDVLNLIDADCAAATKSPAHGGGHASSGTSAGAIIGYTLGGVAGTYVTLLGSTLMYCYHRL